MKKKTIGVFFGLLCLSMISGCQQGDRTAQGSDYVLEEDSQPGMRMMRECAEGEKGYYIESADSLLYFYDKESGKTHPLCNKPQCTHEGLDCNAFFYGGAPKYYKGDIYTLQSDENEEGDICLYRYRGDGSGKEKVYRVRHIEKDESSEDLFSACIHRGYLYYEWNGESDSTIYRRALEKDAEEEEIKTMPGWSKNQSLYGEICAAGDNVYFGLEHRKDATTDLLSYDIQSGKINKELEEIKNLYYYTMDGTTLYYSTDKAVYEKDLETEKVTEFSKLPEGKAVALELDKNYLVLDTFLQTSQEIYRADGYGDKEPDAWYKDRKVYIYERKTKKEIAQIPLSHESTTALAQGVLIDNYNFGDTFSILPQKEWTGSQKWKIIYQNGVTE